jgi:hypothetical protein
MKAICIDNKMPARSGHTFTDITIGKIYDVVRKDDNDWIIINDNKEQCLYLKNNLMALEDWREQQIDKVI